jgi:chemotaxis family two-component system response regulator Rcp1
MVHALKQTTMYHNLNIVHDGVEAMDFLRRHRTFPDAPRPDIILLDLNMPRMDGRELLAEIKQDPDLQLIPVVIFTTSASEDDLRQTYQYGVNSYLTKPADLQQFLNVVQSIQAFWFGIATLPSRMWASNDKQSAATKP